MPFIWINLNPLHPRMLCSKFKWNYFTFLLGSPLEERRGLSYEKILIASIKGCFVACLVEIGPVVPEKKFFKYFQYYFTISLLSLLGEGRDPSFEQAWFPFIQGCSVLCLVEIGPVVLEKKILITFNMILHFFYMYYHPWKKAWHFIWIDMNSLHPRMLSAIFCRKWPSGFKYFQFKFTILLLSPLRERRGPSFEQAWFPSIQGVLCYVWFKLARWFCIKIFLKYFQCNFTFSLLSFLGKGRGPSFEQTWIPLPKDALCYVWLNLAQWFWRRNWKCKKISAGQQTDRQTTDNRRSESSLQLSAQVS